MSDDALRKSIIKRQVLKVAPPVGAGVIAAWVYVIYSLCQNPEDRALIGMGVAGTVIGVIWIAVAVGRRVALVSRGVEVVGRVNEIGMVSRYGMRSITVRYEYNGQVYRKAFMGSPETYPMGAHVPLVIDPAAPGRFEVKSEL